MDHYENQLYSLFRGFDFESSGTLGRDGLISLCNTLQLEEKGIELVNRLVDESSNSKISFAQFRDGLLLILGDEFSNNTHSNNLQIEMDSPGREVLPKYVYGSKKYGRRSRPQISSPQELVYNDNDSIPGNSLHIHSECNKVQRSLSHSEVVKRRIKNEKLKRCISFPGSKRNNDERIHNKENLLHSNSLNVNNLDNVDFEEAKKICDNLGILSCDDSILIQIFDKLKDRSGKVILDEFLYQIESEVENAESVTASNLDKIPDTDVSLYFGECLLDTIQNEVVVEMWEMAGISHAQQLLSDLGFHEITIKVSELLTVLDEEIKMIYSHSHKESEPSLNLSLLQATLCLHQYEIKKLKIEMNQIIAERDKLRSDLTDANLRAQMLAQEVDENQLRIEASLRNRVKQSEMKHLDEIRELSNQFLNEKDILTNTVTKYEQKISSLEMDDQKYKNIITNLENSNENLEKEINQYQEKLIELEQVKMQLFKELKAIKGEKELWQLEEAKNKSSEISLLIEKLTEVQLENKSLKDRNDELSVEVECLQNKMSNSGRCLSLTKTTCAVDISGEEATSWSVECNLEPLSWGSQADLPGGYGVKRRNNNENDDAFMSEEESPRISKVRKCHKKKQTKENQNDKNKANNDSNALNDTSKCTSESGLECDGDSGSDGSSGQDRINFVQIIEKIQLNKFAPIECYQPMIKLMTEIWKDLRNIIDLQSCSCDPCVVKQHLRKLCNKLLDKDNLKIDDSDLLHISVENSENENLKLIIKEMESKFNDSSKLWQEEKNNLTKQCNEFEVSIEQLRTEYEKCEDYWQSKLTEEREIFDQEQRISDEKFNDLLHKMAEYEDQFAQHDKSYGPLSTIEERYSLERQFTDLEDEMEDYKKNSEEKLRAKNLEVELLTQQLKHLEKAKINIISENDNVDSLIKLEHTTNINNEAFKNSLTVEEVANVFSDTKIISPIEYLWNQSTIQLDIPVASKPQSDSTRDYQNPAFNTKAKQLTVPQEKIISSKKLELENEKNLMDPIKKPDSPIRCKSADAIKSRSDRRDFMLNCNFHGDLFKFSNFKQSLSMNCDQVMLQCSDLENHLLRSNEVNNYGFYNGSSTSMPESFTYEQSAHMRIVMLEQRCQQLQLALRQQQAYADSLIQQAWNSAQVECNVLRARLASADLLVQQLYVDNCRLVAALQSANSSTVQTFTPPSTTS